MKFSNCSSQGSKVRANVLLWFHDRWESRVLIIHITISNKQYMDLTINLNQYFGLAVFPNLIPINFKRRGFLKIWSKFLLSSWRTDRPRGNHSVLPKLPYSKNRSQSGWNQLNQLYTNCAKPRQCVHCKIGTKWVQSGFETAPLVNVSTWYCISCVHFKLEVVDT